MARLVKNAKPLPAGCAVILGLLFLAGGLALAWFLGAKGAMRAREVRSWERVPCVVEKASVIVEVPPSGEPVIKPDVIYTYTREGKEVTGSTVYDSSQADNVNELEEVLAGFRAAPQAHCYVNPDNLWESVLVQPTYWFSLGMMALGGTFAVVGLLFLTRPLWKRAGGGGSHGCGMIVGPAMCLVFAGAGGACLWFAAKDDWKSTAARMQQAPCTILYSTVKTNTSNSRKSGSKTTYRPDIYFRYDWQGRQWHSEWVDFSKGSYSSSNRSGAEDTVRRYPKGSAQTCWVDPEKPWVAVLEKDARGSWLLWLVGGIFGGLGALGLLFYLIKLGFLAFALKKDKPAGPPPLPPELPS